MKDGLINHLHLANYRVRMSNKRQTTFEGQDGAGGGVCVCVCARGVVRRWKNGDWVGFTQLEFFFFFCRSSAKLNATTNTWFLQSAEKAILCFRKKTLFPCTACKVERIDLLIGFASVS